MKGLTKKARQRVNTRFLIRLEIMNAVLAVKKLLENRPKTYAMVLDAYHERYGFKDSVFEVRR